MTTRGPPNGACGFLRIRIRVMVAEMVRAGRVAGEHRVELADGSCRASIGGPGGGAELLLIHGATMGSWIFDRLVEPWHQAGLRTIRLDLFGHGRSDRPLARYDHGLFERQVVELLDRLGCRSVDVLGHALGVAIVARGANRHPGRIRRLLLSARPSWTSRARLGCCAGLGDVAMTLAVVPFQRRRRTRRWRGIEDGKFVRLFERQLETPGFGRALKSMLRAGTLGDQTESYRELGRRDRSIFVLRGEAGRDRAGRPGRAPTRAPAPSRVPRAPRTRTLDAAHGSRSRRGARRRSPRGLRKARTPRPSGNRSGAVPLTWEIARRCSLSSRPPP